jgi:succinate dehydrogenase hydrophobic anchor subunit
MESLALLAAAIVAVAVIGGPLSLFFSWLRTKNRRKHLQLHRRAQNIYAALILLFGLPALVVGIRLITLDLAIGGKIFGFIGALTSLIALIQLIRSRK